VQTGNLRTNPVEWDRNVCHTYWYVYFGQGNVAQNIFEGDAPPPLRHHRRLDSTSARSRRGARDG